MGISNDGRALGRVWRALLALVVAMLILPVTIASASAESGPKKSPADDGGESHSLRAKGHERTASASAPSGNLGSGPAANLEYHNGPVMRDPTVYAIFWDPGNNMAQAYRDTIERYFTDIGSTPYLNINTQYTDGNGPVPPTSHFGASTVDTRAYPHAGTFADPVTRADVQQEITNQTAHPEWQGPDLSTMYFVFLGQNIIECKGANDCFAGPGVPAAAANYCAYHGAFNGDTIFATQPYAASSTRCGSNTAYPNGRDQDLELSPVSHEQFEAYSDPHINAWYDDDKGNENGDNCAYNYGQLEPDGTNIVLNGHRYQIQTEWSNADGGCVKRYGPASQLSVAGALDFGTVPRGSSQTKRIALENTASGDMNVLNVRLGTNPSGFFSLSPGQPTAGTVRGASSMVVDVTFSPSASTAQTGPLTPTLIVDTDQPGQETNTISGAATIGQPQLEVSGSLDFGTVPRGTTSTRTVVVQNVGHGDLGITNIALAGSSDPDFSISPTSPTSGSLPPGGSLTVEVAFSPPSGAGTAGPRTGSLVISTNDPARPTATVPATGTAGIPQATLSPASLNFGIACPGGSVDRELTVTNTGTAPLKINSVTVGGGSSAGFSVLSPPNLPLTLPVGSHLSFTVRFTPAGPMGGPAAATVQVNTDDPVNPTVSVQASATVGAPSATLGSNALDFGGVPVDDRTSPHARDLPVTLTNSGSCPLTLSAAPTITGPHASDFSIVGAPSGPVVIGPGSSITFSVRFNPSAPGPRVATLSIATSDPVNPSVSVSLNGEGLLPAIATSSESLTFGPTVIQSQAPGYPGRTQNLTVTNVGQAELIADTLSVGAAPFSGPAATNPPARYAANDHFDEPVRFAPTTAGKFLGNAVVSDNVGFGVTKTVPLCGEGVMRGIRVLAVDANGNAFPTVKALKLSAHGTAQKVNVNDSNLSLQSVTTSCDPTQQRQYENQSLPATDTLNQRSSYYVLSVTAGGKSTTITFTLGVDEFKTIVVTIK